MATNPQPTHITAEMWWFIEQAVALGNGDIVFSGAWGSFKPGYHCDAFTLWWHKDKSGAFDWRNDYSTKLPADKVLGTPLEKFGAGVDLTFTSAQRGDFRHIRLIGGRIRQAHAARDPRCHGWREVLIQGDPDAPADGYDFVSWTERTPDNTHTWHGHFSRLRSFLADLTGYQAMLSIMRGETLAQWQARGGEDMVIYQLPNGWVGCSTGTTRYGYATEADLKEAMAAFGITTLRKITEGQLGAYGVDVRTIEGDQLVLTDEQVKALGLVIVDAVPTAAEVADAVVDEEANRLRD